MKLVATVLALTLSLTTPALAADPLIGLPREEFADLVGKASQVPELEAKVKVLEAALDAEKTTNKLRIEIEAIKDQKLAVQAELLDLERERSAYWKGRMEEVESNAKTEIRQAKIQGYATMIGCGLGLLGAPFTGGMSLMAGCALGAGAGALMP